MDEDKDKLSPEDVARQQAELLPDREAMSLIDTNPQGLGGILGGAPAADGTAPTADQAPGLASGAAATGTGTAHSIPVPPADGTYDPNESASSTT
jgi:hypothetical protein